jgi:antirestriction protein
MTNRAFFYVDGTPTKGIWFDIDSTSDTDDVLEALANAKLIPRDEDGEPEYGGDLLVADTEGALAHAFYSSRSDTLDLEDLVEVIEYCEDNHVDEEAAAAYIDDRNEWSQKDFEDAYCGEYESEVAYAEELFDECYMHDVPENVRHYIDYEKFARDLFLSDYYFTNGFVFRWS